MSMTFDNAIEALCNEIKIPDEEHQIFLDDAEVISSKIYETMVETDSVFKDMYKELKRTASYQKGDSFDLPNDFAISLMMELPFQVQPEFYGPFGQFARFKTNKNHPIVNNGLISKDLFIFLVHGNLENIIPNIKPIVCKNGRTYSLKLKPIELQNLLQQTIIATEQVKTGSGGKIFFTFLPTLKFPIDKNYAPLVANCDKEAKYWTALPAYERDIEFYPSIARDQLVEQTHKAKIIYFLRLLNTICIKFGNELWHENDFKIKLLYFQQVHDDGKAYIENVSKSKVIVDWLRVFAKTITLESNISLVDKLNEIHAKLKDFQLINAVDLDDLLKLFGLA